MKTKDKPLHVDSQRTSGKAKVNKLENLVKVAESAQTGAGKAAPPELHASFFEGVSGTMKKKGS